MSENETLSSSLNINSGAVKHAMRRMQNKPLRCLPTYPLFTPAFHVSQLTSTSASYLMKANTRIVWASDKPGVLCYGEATASISERQDVYQTTYRRLKNIFKSKSGLIWKPCRMITVQVKLGVHCRSLIPYPQKRWFYLPNQFKSWSLIWVFDATSIGLQPQWIQICKQFQIYLVYIALHHSIKLQLMRCPSLGDVQMSFQLIHKVKKKN